MVEIATDSSGYKWGAVLGGKQNGDLWRKGVSRLIHVKKLRLCVWL